MTKTEIQSVEVSFFVHATEDEPRLIQRIEESLHLGATPKLEQFRGHFGNSITRVSYHITAEDATRLCVSLASRLGTEGANAILERIDTMMDEHRALYLRLSKQQLVSGKIALESNDSVRLKVKPRSFMIGRDARSFYAKVMGLSS